MFGFFKKQAPEVHTRKGENVGEMRLFPYQAVQQLVDLDPDLALEEKEEDGLSIGYLSCRGLKLRLDLLANLSRLDITNTISECNIERATSIEEKAFFYRCIDEICFRVPGVRAFFHPESGDLVVGVQSAGFETQFRADTLIDIALYMLEEAVFHARTYLGLPATPVPPIHVSQWDGGYHFGEGFKTYASARDAFAAYMEKHCGCQEVRRDERSVVLQSGPVQYEVLEFGWPNAYMVMTGTRGFRHIYHNDELYVRVQERLAQPILKPGAPDELPREFRSSEASTIAYFQPDGTFILAQYGFGNIRTDENGKAFGRVAGAHMADVYAMTYLAGELPEELYSDVANRVN